MKFLNQKLGGATSEIMCDLLAFEADRRAVNITINRWALRGFLSISLISLHLRPIGRL
jgi:hypothetical protein